MTPFMLLGGLWPDQAQILDQHLRQVFRDFTGILTLLQNPLVGVFVVKGKLASAVVE